MSKLMLVYFLNLAAVPKRLVPAVWSRLAALRAVAETSLHIACEPWHIRHWEITTQIVCDKKSPAMSTALHIAVTSVSGDYITE